MDFHTTFYVLQTTFLIIKYLPYREMLDESIFPDGTGIGTFFGR